MLNDNDTFAKIKADRAALFDALEGMLMALQNGGIQEATESAKLAMRRAIEGDK